MSTAGEDRRPLLLIHRDPRYDNSFFASIHEKFIVLDPLVQPLDAELSNSVRLMLTTGPTPVTSDVLDKYPALECIVGTSAGINHFDLDACRRRGIRVTSAGEVFSDDVADYAVGLTIDVLRRVAASDRFVRAGLWNGQIGFTLGTKVSGKRVGIVGLGSIGSRVARRFEGYDCSIAYTSRNKKSNIAYPFYPNVVDLASNVDILILCCALTDKTRHIVNSDVMSALGETGVIINVGRGALIDEKELVQFLVSRKIGGAGLDVFEHEPQVPEALLKLDNVVLSPHQAVLTRESFAALHTLVTSNLEAFYLNKPLQAEIKNMFNS